MFTGHIILIDTFIFCSKVQFLNLNRNQSTYIILNMLEKKLLNSSDETYEIKLTVEKILNCKLLLEKSSKISEKKKKIAPLLHVFFYCIFFFYKKKVFRTFERKFHKINNFFDIIKAF